MILSFASSLDDSDSQSGTDDEGVGVEEPLSAMKEKLSELNTCENLNCMTKLSLLDTEFGRTKL